MTQQELNKECEEILRKIIARYGFLQLNSHNFDVWDNKDAANVVADLIIELNKSDIIQQYHQELDWGK